MFRVRVKERIVPMASEERDMIWIDEKEFEHASFLLHFLEECLNNEDIIEIRIRRVK